MVRMLKSEDSLEDISETEMGDGCEGKDAEKWFLQAV
jgi:hypothetical protein